MTRNEMVQIMLESYCKPVAYHDDGGVQLGYKLWRMLEDMEKAGIKPPQLEKEKTQFLFHKYIEPSYNHWDEDFYKQHKEEYEMWLKNRGKK